MTFSCWKIEIKKSQNTKVLRSLVFLVHHFIFINDIFSEDVPAWYLKKTTSVDKTNWCKNEAIIGCRRITILCLPRYKWNVMESAARAGAEVWRTGVRNICCMLGGFAGQRDSWRFTQEPSGPKAFLPLLAWRKPLSYTRLLYQDKKRLGLSLLLKGSHTINNKRT